VDSKELAELAEHPILTGLGEDLLASLAAHTRTVRFPAASRIFDEGQVADRFWLVCDGQVALDLHVPGRGTLLVDMVSPGAVLGWSWLFPPYRWRFGATAAAPTRAMEIEAGPVRELAANDAEFGRATYQRFSEVAVGRLQATRLRLLDVFPEAAQRSWSA
jgi:CRP/FNR family transcriptional regulator, cyclic AMP receptor protein